MRRKDFYPRLSAARAIGFSLGEIRELILIQDDQIETCSHVRDLIQQKLATVQEKMNELAQIEGQLKEALQKCNRQLRKTSARHDRCPVLEIIASSENAKESKSA